MDSEAMEPSGAAPTDLQWWQFVPHGLFVLVAGGYYKIARWWLRKVNVKLGRLQEDKADKAETDAKFATIAARLERQDDTSARRHTENTQRMDQILFELTRRRGD